jgi:hypothetical protein
VALIIALLGDDHAWLEVLMFYGPLQWLFVREGVISGAEQAKSTQSEIGTVDRLKKLRASHLLEKA